jgi:CsoR family transcriptional regulator, copper-sensing transcriptional repressor
MPLDHGPDVISTPPSASAPSVLAIPSAHASSKEHHHGENHSKNNHGENNHSENNHQSAHHIHSEESRKRIVNRLARIEGHIRGIKAMVQEDRPCPDVLIQVAAVRGGLDRVARIILDEHLSECISRAVSEGNVEEEIGALKAALDRFI